MKGKNPKQWWREVKRLGGMTSHNGDLISQINIDELESLLPQAKANKINTAFLEPLEQYRLPSPLSPMPLESPEFLQVSESRVLKLLTQINPAKASGPDNISNWFLNEYAELLAFYITQILNASYSEQRLPKDWKMADVLFPLPKKESIEDRKKDFRPISLTPCISKLAEDFVVEDFIKPAALKVITSNQFGVIPKSSTTQALISMLHHWTLATDGNGNTVRTILVGYRKAFDFIDHNILIIKLCQLDLPRSKSIGSLTFLAIGTSE